MFEVVARLQANETLQAADEFYVHSIACALASAMDSLAKEQKDKATWSTEAAKYLEAISSLIDTAQRVSAKANYGSDPSTWPRSRFNTDGVISYLKSDAVDRHRTFHPVRIEIVVGNLCPAGSSGIVILLACNPNRSK